MPGLKMADTGAERLADQMVKAEEAYSLIVLGKKTLRAAALEMRISHESVRQLVKAYKLYLSDETRDEEITSKRASELVELNDLIAKALYVYEKTKDSKPLTAVGAINSAIAAHAHKRAVDGLDTPKAVEAKQDVTYTVKWSEE